MWISRQSCPQFTYLNLRGSRKKKSFQPFNFALWPALVSQSTNHSPILHLPSHAHSQIPISSSIPFNNHVYSGPVNHLLQKFLPSTKFYPIVTREFRPPKPHPAGILHISSSWGLEDGGDGLIMVTLFSFLSARSPVPIEVGLWRIVLRAMGVEGKEQRRTFPRVADPNYFELDATCSYKILRNLIPSPLG